MTDAIVRFLLVGAGVFLFMVAFAWMILGAVFPRGGSGFIAGLLLGWIAGRQRPAQVVVRGATEPSPVLQAEPRRRLRWLWIVLGALALYAIARHEARADQVFKPTREAARAERVSIAKGLVEARGKGAAFNDNNACGQFVDYAFAPEDLTDYASKADWLWTSTS
ncbi:MAG TPA: hypothetical protein VIJ63_00020 [Roseiarcus sp.]